MDNFTFILIIILLVVFIGLLIAALIYVFNQLREAQKHNEKIVKNYEVYLKDSALRHDKEVEKARLQSVAISRSTIKGQIAEQFAPLLNGFPYLPSDSRFLGDPVDYVVFKGYTDYKDEKTSGEDLEVVIVDIKHNKAVLSAGQKQIAKAIENGRVRFETIRISEDGTLEVQSWSSNKKK